MITSSLYEIHDNKHCQHSVYGGHENSSIKGLILLFVHLVLRYALVFFFFTKERINRKINV